MGNELPIHPRGGIWDICSQAARGERLYFRNILLETDYWNANKLSGECHVRCLETVYLKILRRFATHAVNMLLKNAKKALSLMSLKKPVSCSEPYYPLRTLHTAGFEHGTAYTALDGLQVQGRGHRQWNVM